MSELYIGLLSGTSADAIDAVLVDLSNMPRVVAFYNHPIPSNIQQAILQFHQPSPNEINCMGELSTQLGREFAAAVKYLLEISQTNAESVKAIGSHGQNIRHHPHGKHPFTLQIGDPNIIAAETGITTVADFRRRDIALGGQGAPLAPVFHQHIFRHTTIDRLIVNIGGIANISYLPAKLQQTCIGFDIGPGNALMNEWIYHHHQKNYDKNGTWASTGAVIPQLLDELIADAYFKSPHPKSTGREYFNLRWLHPFLTNFPEVKPEDIQATLLMLTATTIVDTIIQQTQQAEVILCGGGAYNLTLRTAISKQLPESMPLYTSKDFGISPDEVEAVLFAWLAQQRLQNNALDFRKITGASKPGILGAIYAG